MFNHIYPVTVKLPLTYQTQSTDRVHVLIMYFTNIREGCYIVEHPSKTDPKLKSHAPITAISIAKSFELCT